MFVSFRDRWNEYWARMGVQQPSQSLAADRNTVWLEQQFGAALDAMPLASQLALLAGQDFKQSCVRRFGAQSPMVRPELLLALHRRSQSDRRQPKQLLETPS